jgi:hypothetical protein
MKARGWKTMTLLDAPVFDEAREKRKLMIGYSAAAGLVVLFILWWILAGRPVDWPWRWNSHLFGRMAINRFMNDIEKNDLEGAYGVWVHDKNWQQHPPRGANSFERFKEGWDPKSPDAEYPAVIHSHRIASDRIYGNVLLVAILINGAKQNALDLTYDPKTGQLSYAPPGVRLSTDPWKVIP